MSLLSRLKVSCGCKGGNVTVTISLSITFLPPEDGVIVTLPPLCPHEAFMDKSQFFRM